MPFKKGKSGRIARALKAKEPQLIEGPKHLLCLRGPATSDLGTRAVKDLAALKKPRSKLLQRKNDIRPFEDATSIEFLAEKNDCGAFLLTSHSKKRPHNLVLGRLFDGHIMDLVELGIEEYVSLEDIKGAKKALGASPCMIFAGDEWDRSTDLGKLRSLILDVFAARDLTGISLPGLDHVLMVATKDNKVFFRGYHMSFKRADDRVPRVELEPMGPSLDLVIRRTQHASPELEKAATRVPKQLKSKKTKNVTTDVFGEEHGQLHMERQDFGKLQLRKTGAYKVRGGKAGEDDAEEVAMDEEDAPAAAAAAPIPAGTKRRRDA